MPAARFSAKGVPLNIAVWNTFKGRRERYYDFLAEKTADAELILLQEFRHDPFLEASHRDMFRGRDAGMAVSFYTRPQSGIADRRLHCFFDALDEDAVLAFALS